MSVLPSRQSADQNGSDELMGSSSSGSSDEEALEDVNGSNSVIGVSSSNSSDQALCGKSNNIRNIRFRAKKHLVGRITTRNSLRPLIGRRASACLKAFEDLAKLHIKDVVEQKRLFQSVIKSLGKMGVIAKQGNLSEERMEIARKLKDELRVIAMVVCTFARTQYTYDRAYLVKQVINCEQNLHACVSGLLSEKSTARLHYVFGVLKNESLLDGIFSPSVSRSQREALLKFAQTIEVALAASSSSGANDSATNGPQQ